MGVQRQLVKSERLRAIPVTPQMHRVLKDLKRRRWDHYANHLLLFPSKYGLGC